MLSNEMKILVTNYSCLQKPWLGGHHPQIPIISVRCPQWYCWTLPEKNSGLHHSHHLLFLLKTTVFHKWIKIPSSWQLNITLLPHSYSSSCVTDVKSNCMKNCITVCVSDNIAAYAKLSVFVTTQLSVIIFLFQKYRSLNQIVLHIHTNTHTHTHTHSVTLNIFRLLYFKFCSSQHTSLNLTVCHVPCASTNCTNCCSDTPKLTLENQTHITLIFALPQHNLQNTSEVSEDGFALYGPHILHSIILVLVCL